MNKYEFTINAKDWLSDPNIFTMDWDCKAVHMHLLCFAAQQTPIGYLLNDDLLFLKIFSHLTTKDWNERVKPQVMTLWDDVSLEKNGIFQPFIYSKIFNNIHENTNKNTGKGRVKTHLKNSKDTQTSSQALAPHANQHSKEQMSTQLEIFESPLEQGFSIKDILKHNTSTTILFEPPTEKDTYSIWNIGVSLLEQQGKTQTQARSFIAKLIKTYSQKSVANIFAQISLKETKPADLSSYIIWALKQEQDIQKTTSNRGRVSI